MFLGIAGSTMESRASADLTSVSIDPNDLQQFEQSYENWVQGLAQNLIPSQKPTVLIEMNYTQNPERLQHYSELRETRHLPGLPEVMDPHITHPSESPLSALVDGRRIKIIFEHVLTAAQEKLLAEVLNNKLRINAHAGDRLILSTLESPAPVAPSRFKDPRFILSLIAACLAIAVTLARTRRNRSVVNAAPATGFALPAVEPTGVVTPPPAPIPAPRAFTPPPPPVKPFQFNDQDRTVIQRLMQVDSTLMSKTSSIVSPTQIILKADPKAIIRVIRSESADNVARAIHGTSILFQKTILSICTPQQRNRIRDFAKKERIRKGQTLFAQNLIAAKIYREMQILNARAVDRFAQAQETLRSGKAELNQIRHNLARAQNAPAANNGSERAPEVQA